MGLLRWLKSIRGRMHERPKAIVSFNDRGVVCDRPDGSRESVDWDELRLVELRTTDAGPIVEDVFLVLHAGDHGCVVPQEAEGFGALLERLHELPGFDNQAFISAMACTDNEVFTCWRRTSE